MPKFCALFQNNRSVIFSLFHLTASDKIVKAQLWFGGIDKVHHVAGWELHNP